MRNEQVRIEHIVIRRRIRKDLRDLNPLIESIRRYGLMNPIVVNDKMELIAGHRRLESVKALGWKTVPVTIVERNDDERMLEMEIEENVQRADLSPDELADAYFRLDRLKNPRFFRRLWIAVIHFLELIFTFGRRRKRPRR